MRRLLFVVPLAVLLVVPSSALAADTYKGHGTNDRPGKVKFEVNDARTQVNFFRSSNFHFTCNNGDSGRTGAIRMGAIPINDRNRFEDRQGIPNIRSKVRGHIQNGRAEGHVRLEQSGGGAECDTGREGWVAHRR